jgi:hypothetical protein
MTDSKYKQNKTNKLSNKQNISSSLVTLDGKHKEYINKFEHNENIIIPQLKIEKTNLINTINTSNIPVEKQIEIIDRINEIKTTIKNLKNQKKKYYLNNTKLIFDYFENKKNISEGLSTNKNKNSLINEFFKIKPETNDVIDINYKNTNNIVQKYLTNINESNININDFVYNSNICKYCNKGEMIPIEDEGILICNICSKYIPYLIENEKPSYKEPPKEVCFYAYKKINHFKEIISQFQGKETTQIPLTVIECIKKQIKKERIQLDELTNDKTKEILKKLGYNKYYEHIPFIKDKLGIKPPVMPLELEEKLYCLFSEIQAPYAKYCPVNRVNFLNYYYTLFKLCELLGETQYLHFFPMLKDPEKRIEQDYIWKKICAEFNWNFIPTI